ncbi:MAG: hypothetical protein ACYC5H_00965 [Methylovirgula sp.]
MSPQIRNRSFAEILDDLIVPSEETTDTASPTSIWGASRQSGWFPHAAEDAEIDISPRAGDTAAYYAEAADDAVATMDDMEDEDQIVVELDLESVATLADLARARRNFALRNHPDLFHPPLRMIANRRMQLANMLLDRRRREIEAGR